MTWFQVIISVLRTDKLLESAHSFVSDHVGYKFVEPVQFDLGRVFSECEASQPLIYLVTIFITLYVTNICSFKTQSVTGIKT
jgi:hypothetical protein